MKTFDGFKGTTLLAAIVALSAALAGCSSGGGGGSSAASPYLFGANNCVGCGGSSLGTGAAEIAAPGSGSVGIAIEMQFFAPSSVNSPVAGSQYITQQNYSGQIGANGLLNVYVDPTPNSCVIIPGQYSIQTAQAGTLQGNSVYGLILQGTGTGGAIAVAIANAYIAQSLPNVMTTPDGNTFSNVVHGRVQIMPQTQYGCNTLSLNGQMVGYYENYTIGDAP